MNVESFYKEYLKYPNVVIDSRKVTPGSIFFAFKGEKTDGNLFAQKAIAQGAAYSIVDNAEIADGKQLLYQQDVLGFLSDLANYHRKQLHIPVLAITGSNGKTTTKELIHRVLSSQYKTHTTLGNLNNHLGVPLTLLSMPLDTEIAIIEMGANHQQEITTLCEIAEPTHGVVTNFGKAHLEGFGGEEGVRKGKSELYKFLSKNKGLGFINLDEPNLLDWALKKGLNRVVRYHCSQEPSPNHIPIEVRLNQLTSFVNVSFISENNEMIDVQSHLVGVHNFNNIMTAIAIGKYFKINARNIAKAIASYQPDNNRSQILKLNTNTFVLDAYNANPSSMKMAIDAFQQMTHQPKIAILGSMKELGASAEVEHQFLINYIEQNGFLKQLVLVGNEFSNAYDTCQAIRFEDVTSLKDWFTKQNFSDTLFLVKGSRSNHLEDLIK